MVWAEELKGRPMYDGIRIKIEKKKKDNLAGRVVALNDNKYVKLFVEKDDIWVPGITFSF